MSETEEWTCEECGWTWPLPGRPPREAECDNCGGALVQGVTAMTGKRGDLMATVWIVSERIDYHGSEVCGVFSTKEAAEAHALDHRPTDFHEITEWTIDSHSHSGWRAL